MALRWLVTEIIAPYVKDKGTYYAAAMDPTSKDREDKEYNAELKKLLDAHPDLYGKVKWSVLAKGKYDIAPDGTRGPGGDVPQHPQLGVGRR